jgi:hypothetical protein
VSSVLGIVPAALSVASGSFAAPGALLGVGFLVAVYGHLTKTKWLIATGLILIAVAAFMLQFTFKTTSHGPPPLNGPGGGAG